MIWSDRRANGDTNRNKTMSVRKPVQKDARDLREII